MPDEGSASKKGEDVLFGSNILLMAPLVHAASRRTTNSNPSLDMSVTYLLRPEPAPACEDSIMDAATVGLEDATEVVEERVGCLALSTPHWIGSHPTKSRASSRSLFAFLHNPPFYILPLFLAVSRFFDACLRLPLRTNPRKHQPSQHQSQFNQRWIMIMIWASLVGLLLPLP